MECDSTHSLIQRKINNRQINLPFPLVDFIKEARRNPFPLNVHHLDHTYFKNYESIPKRYTSMRPGKKIGDPTVSMIRVLGYDSTGSIYYKINITDDYIILPQRLNENLDCPEPSPLHKERLKISKKKWEHLQDLKSLLPQDCHYFYDNIPFES